MKTHVTRGFALWGLALLALGCNPDGAEKPTAEAIQKGQKLIEQRLQGSKGAVIEAIADDAVVHAFPGRLFFGVRFRMYPVPHSPREPLKLRNIFVIEEANTLKHLTDSQALVDYVLLTLSPVKTDSEAKRAARAWLVLAEELVKDGYFQFSIPASSLVVERDKGGRKVSGKAAVEPKRGDQGELNVTLTFDESGKLLKISQKNSVQAGMRPKCQATKLLDPDPIVRYMAEQSIVIMGSSAKGYLDEQRAVATPELAEAIDRIWQRIVDEGR
jgi:hypothetical protein